MRGGSRNELGKTNCLVGTFKTVELDCLVGTFKTVELAILTLGGDFTTELTTESDTDFLLSSFGANTLSGELIEGRVDLHNCCSFFASDTMASIQEDNESGFAIDTATESSALL